jgi:hypothetical protein
MSTGGSKLSHRKFPFEDYTLLYNILSTYDWVCVHGTTSVVSAVASLNAAAQVAMEQAIPRGIINSKLKFSHNPLSYSYYIRRFKKFDRRYQNFSFAS